MFCSRPGACHSRIRPWEIGGEHYWDGGYTGNPPLAPLYLQTTATDVVIIGINPLLRTDVPRTALE